MGWSIWWSRWGKSRYHNIQTYEDRFHIRYPWVHDELSLPTGDLILHAGDITDHGSKSEVEAFLSWFSALDYAHKIFIGGNHDIFLDEYPVDLRYTVLKHQSQNLCIDHIHASYRTEIQGKPASSMPLTSILTRS